MEPHPIRLVVEDDLRRSRLTVFFRLILAIPHLIWITLWSIGVFFVAILSWFIVLFTGRLPEPLHRFFSKFVRYSTHLYAYLYLAANEYPGFVGEAGDYPVDLKVDKPAAQSRWKTLFRFFLAFPALLVTGTLVGAPSGGGGGSPGQYSSTGTQSGDEWWWSIAFSFGGSLGVVALAAFFGWFACIALGRMPMGFRGLAAYGLRYSAQTAGYLLFLTDRYPNADPFDPPPRAPTPDQPVRIRIEDDLRAVAADGVLPAPAHDPALRLAVRCGASRPSSPRSSNWFATLITGRSPEALHNFLGGVPALRDPRATPSSCSSANPFPGFTGEYGSYPIDLEIDPRGASTG